MPESATKDLTKEIELKRLAAMVSSQISKDNAAIQMDTNTVFERFRLIHSNDKEFARAIESYNRTVMERDSKKEIKPAVMPSMGTLSQLIEQHAFKSIARALPIIESEFRNRSISRLARNGKAAN